ncbi:7-methylguanosine phosphate-specific 5'-nucleotidase-like isoform X2 [Cimex lectularius]|uniref:5'-nucleotidase n=1 Tax=Cimex lectularius TaxID=79782 RepID=A0A8I6S790_CIMLE|nr:7-methylguanosine phosphate-specific 5'-nucleotidase-like isoform X2 [Cimex lectularius]
MANLLIPELNKGHVKMKNKNDVLKKIQLLVDSGPEKLQVITDFDRTITKHNSPSSYAIYKLIPTLSKEFLDATDSLYKKFRVIEENPKMSREEKLPHMIEWWESNEKWFIGLPYNIKDIDNAAKDSKVKLRLGTETVFYKMNKHEIPVLVFSAGLGDMVSAIIKEYNLDYDKVKVISNFFKVENEKVIGFQGQTLHIYNKNQHAIENTDYFKELSHRENAIVMGDSLGDANMAEGVQGNGTILKIGFLSHHVEDYLSQYLDLFDIVLVKDETFDIFNTILDKILGD